VRLRRSLALVTGLALVLAVQGIGQSATKDRNSGRTALRNSESALPDGFVPAAIRARQLGRYFVELKADSVSDVLLHRGPRSGGGAVSAPDQRNAAAAALRAQEGAIAQTKALGGSVTFRYRILINAFSAKLSAAAAAALAKRADVRSVQPVSIVKKDLTTSVPFIGAPEVWSTFGVRGGGMRVALVDTGIDYTHASFGGEGTPEAYAANDPTFIEPGSFPTAKVIGGFDFVGENYDVLDADTSNDTPRPDFDPLDEDGHGSHTGSTIAGIRVPGNVGRGVAPLAKLYAYKVWDVGNSTDDVLVAAYERAVDPNQDGDVSDQADVLSFSGGVDYGTLNSLEAKAAQRVTDIGTVFVASAGNSGHPAVGGSSYIVGTPAVARGVVAVAASIDQFLATTLTVNSPSGIVLPDNGILVHQDWSGDFPPGGYTADLFDGREVDDASTDPADQMFCSALPANSLAGKTVLVYKGATGAGDCDGSLKVFNAQNAGASAVILVSLFGGLPFGLGPGAFGDQITIPVVMVSGADGGVLLDAVSPNYPTTFNEVVVNVTLSDALVEVPGFDDAMTDFTSGGPARLTSDLKPDISAPGFNISAAAVGTGNESIELSGTSMAAPHVSGVAVLLRQLHPNWSPAQIKGVLMNQATRNMKNNDLSTPVSATVMGSGRVDAFQSARARSVAWPGSLSYGFAPTPTSWSAVRSFRVKNFDTHSHGYTVTAADRASDYDPAMTSLAVSLDGSSFGASRSFSLSGSQQRKVWVRLTLDPTLISEAEQEYGWYYIQGNLDGTVQVSQSGTPSDVLRLPWHVVPLATSDNGLLSTDPLDLTLGQGTLELTEGTAAGTSYADLYQLGETDPAESRGEEDIVAVGARSFAGNTIDGTPEGLPPGNDQLADIDWLTFLTDVDTPAEPVEIGVQTWGVHNVTETLEVDVLIDAGADGQFADTELQADYMAVKLAAPGGEVCVFALPSTFEDCDALYFADYSNYNSNLVGLALDAQAIGLVDGESDFAYQVTACTGTFSGDVPGQICDSAGAFDDTAGTWNLVFDAADPALLIDPLVCQGFWGGPACDSTTPITVDAGSAGTGDDPSILVLFPNDRPHRTATVVETTT
jgi:minor extracellular serine protease Vpr